MLCNGCSALCGGVSVFKKTMMISKTLTILRVSNLKEIPCLYYKVVSLSLNWLLVLGRNLLFIRRSRSLEVYFLCFNDSIYMLYILYIYIYIYMYYMYIYIYILLVWSLSRGMFFDVQVIVPLENVPRDKDQSRKTFWRVLTNYIMHAGPIRINLEANHKWSDKNIFYSMLDQ